MGLRNLCAAIGLALLGACMALPGFAADSVSPGGIAASALPMSIADIPQAAALRTAPRVALVIGNDRYRSLGGLRFAGSDARAVAQSLRARGFELVGGDAQIDVSSAQ